MAKRINTSDIERALVEAKNDPTCHGCGGRARWKGAGYCLECQEAVNRLVDRGVYYRDFASDVRWADAIMAERYAHNKDV